MGGYRRILRAAGFQSINFFWPVPGYQSPDYVLSLGNMLPTELRKIKPNYYSRAKAAVLKGLALAKLLKYIVPHYMMTAEKPSLPAE